MKTMKNKNRVYIVHCIDTEGPLYESLDATFGRLEHIHHVTGIEPTVENLQKLQRGEIDLGDRTTAVKKMLDPDFLEYNDTWDKIYNMVVQCMSEEFRDAMLDSDGNGWVYNWFCADFVNFSNNPRRRCMGYHNIFDYYQSFVKMHTRDSVHFHYHPHSFVNDAHLSATDWFRTDSLEQILCRRIIDRRWFPCVNRPGFQVNRPDSHWFMEQYIPFDYSNMATDSTEDDRKQYDWSGGRSGDWRRAPRSWIPYHPSHDDYQIYGRCRRWIARCLNIGTRSYLITKPDIRKAFFDARHHNQILSFCNHDFRDIRKDITHFRGMLQEVVEEYPDVEFSFADPVTAMRETVLQIAGSREPCKFRINTESDSYSTTLNIEASDRIFGTQPYLAIKTKSGQYYHDNFDFQTPFYHWSYTFDLETLPIDAIDKIGIAANTEFGVTTIMVVDPCDWRQEEVYLNEYHKKNKEVS